MDRSCLKFTQKSEDGMAHRNLTSDDHAQRTGPPSNCQICSLDHRLHFLPGRVRVESLNNNSDFTLSVTHRDSIGRHASRGLGGPVYLWLPATILAKHLGLEEVDLRGAKEG